MNPVTKLFVVRVGRDDHQKVWAAITMVRNIGNCPVTFNLLDLSGAFVIFQEVSMFCIACQIHSNNLFFILLQKNRSYHIWWINIFCII